MSRDTGFPVKKPTALTITRSALVLLGCVSLAGTGAGVFYLSNRPNTVSASPPADEKPRPRPPEKIAALGRLEPSGEVIKIAAPSNTDTRVGSLLVTEGDRVAAGQTIAILDSRDRLQASLDRANAEALVARSRLEQVRAGAKQGDIIAQKARFNRSRAELEGQIQTQKATIASLQAQLAGEKAAQQATIARLSAELRDARQDCDRYETLRREEVVSIQERDRFCLRAETAENSLQEAKANLDRLLTTWPEKIREAEANLTRTIATLDEQIVENRAALAAVTEVRSVDVEVARADLVAAEAAVKKAEAELQLAYVRAPKAGEILKVHTRDGESVGTDGIAELGQTGQMYAVAEVYETDITKVRVGQKAIVTSDALAKPLNGTVERVGRQIRRQNIFDTNPTTDSDSRVVEVKIRLDRPSSDQVSGLTAQRVRVAIVL
jgi:ABC exporter DevB family membrane fusion protein